MTVKSMGEFDLEQLPHLLPLQNNAKPTQYPLHTARLLMRGLSTTGLVFALLLLVVAGAMSGWMVWVMDYPMIAFCLVYNSAELITVRVNRKGFHPAVSIVFEMAMSAMLLFIGAIELIGSSSSGSETYQQLITAGGAIALVLGILHFVLFVICCVATHKLRHAACKPRVVVYMMQAPTTDVRRKAVPDADASSSANTSRAAVRDDDAIASHDDVVYGTIPAAPYSPPMSPTFSNRSSMPSTIVNLRSSMPLTVIDANAVSAAAAAHAERSHLSRTPSSATTATINGPPPSYSRYDGPIQPISEDQIAMLPPAPPGMVYLVAGSNEGEKIMTR